MATALAAPAIRYPHETWILDDGDRPEMRRWPRERGIGYITRTADWDGHAAAREGRQPQQRAVRHRGRVPAHPRRRPDPRAGHPGPHPGLLQGPRSRPGPDAAVLQQRPRRRPAGQPGAAVLRPHPAGQGRLERRVLLRLQRRAPPRGPDAARDRRATSGKSRRPLPARPQRIPGRLSARHATRQPTTSPSGTRSTRSQRHRRGPPRARRRRAAARDHLPLPGAGGRGRPGSSSTPTCRAFRPTWRRSPRWRRLEVGDAGVPVVDRRRCRSAWPPGTGRRWAPSSPCRRFVDAVDVDRGRRGPADHADGHHLGHRGHGHLHAPARPWAGKRLPPRGAGPRPRTRGPRHHAAPSGCAGPRAPCR